MRTLAIIALTFIITSCSHSIGTSESLAPESLLDYSSERVSFGLSMPESVDELTEWIDNDQPTRAEVFCSGGDLCGDTEMVLKQFAVPYESLPNYRPGDEVVLYYERVLARDCDTGVSEGKVALGCATSANMIQMVGDHRQFIDPALLDYPDAETAVKAVEKYLNK